MRYDEIVRFSPVTFLGETFHKKFHLSQLRTAIVAESSFSTGQNLFDLALIWTYSSMCAGRIFYHCPLRYPHNHQRLFMDFYLLSFLPNTEWSGTRAVLICICLARLPNLLVWEIIHHWPYYCSDLKSLVKIYKLNILLTLR